MWQLPACQYNKYLRFFLMNGILNRSGIQCVLNIFSLNASIYVWWWWWRKMNKMCGFRRNIWNTCQILSNSPKVLQNPQVFYSVLCLMVSRWPCVRFYKVIFVVRFRELTVWLDILQLPCSPTVTSAALPLSTAPRAPNWFVVEIYYVVISLLPTPAQLVRAITDTSDLKKE